MCSLHLLEKHQKRYSLCLATSVYYYILNITSLSFPGKRSAYSVSTSSPAGAPSRVSATFHIVIVVFILSYLQVRICQANEN